MSPSLWDLYVTSNYTEFTSNFFIKYALPFCGRNSYIDEISCALILVVLMVSLWVPYERALAWSRHFSVSGYTSKKEKKKRTVLITAYEYECCFFKGTLLMLFKQSCDFFEGISPIPSLLLLLLWSVAALNQWWPNIEWSPDWRQRAMIQALVKGNFLKISHVNTHSYTWE